MAFGWTLSLCPSKSHASSCVRPFPTLQQTPCLSPLWVLIHTLYTLGHSKEHLTVLCHIPEMRRTGSCLIGA